ncbi:MULTISPECIES: uridine kinase [Brevundimonas]|jgi:uridine kinase|uniref:uridine/cytidine kinase n=1 Tax=Brevundimonas naejangsanensis TaxID=588932 RepID=A0A172Y4H9_9CAUL|nr:uridine kinase [Brevundimonas naejangsanensis]ANF54129.1 uridine kinase [Brevundimonas naejangsanensis]QBQ48140.1 uridine kinase [Brevundimonas naejangsanensis]
MTILIAITGGSGSGKSTLAEALISSLPDGVATLLREDSYYLDAASVPGFDAATHDFDDVAARDHNLLIADLTALKRGQAITAPVYSFIHHGREPQGEAVGATEVIVVEGTHLLCTPALAALFDIKVFVDTPADIRFIRRLLRDQTERGRTAESVIQQYLGTVRPGHERLTEPSRVHADFIVADATAAVRLEDPQAVVRLAAPVLAHPLLAAWLT